MNIKTTLRWNAMGLSLKTFSAKDWILRVDLDNILSSVTVTSIHPYSKEAYQLLHVAVDAYIPVDFTRHVWRFVLFFLPIQIGCKSFNGEKTFLVKFFKRAWTFIYLDNLDSMFNSIFAWICNKKETFC